MKHVIINLIGVLCSYDIVFNYDAWKRHYVDKRTRYGSSSMTPSVKITDGTTETGKTPTTLKGMLKQTSPCVIIDQIHLWNIIQKDKSVVLTVFEIFAFKCDQRTAKLTFWENQVFSKGEFQWSSFFFKSLFFNYFFALLWGQITRQSKNMWIFSILLHVHV